MGKAKRIRNSKRQNMTGVPSVAQMEAEALRNEPLIDEEPRVPLLEKINDPSAKHRSEAFQALSNLVIDDPETKQALCKKENIKKVLEHVCDIELDVRVAAVGTLRNMTQFGEPSISTELIKNDVFTPLVAVIQQALSTPNADSTVVNQLLCQSVGLLMNLCENSDRALELFSASKILPFFAQFLHPKTYPYELAVTTGQFFFVLTDNNTRAQQELNAIPGYSSTAATLIQDASVPIRIRTLLSGIDANIYSTDMTTLNSHTYVWQTLFQALDCDFSVEAQKLFSRLATMEGEVVVRAIHSNDAIVVDEMPTPQEKIERDARKQQKREQADMMTDEPGAGVPQTDEAKKAEEEARKTEERRIDTETEKLRTELEAFQESIKSQKLALEILTNICSDEFEEPETMDDDAEDDDNDEGEYEQPVAGAADAQTPETATKSSLLWSSGLLSRVLQLAYPLPPMNVQNNRALEGSEWAYNTAKYLNEVQERAVACLGNMLLDPGAKSNIKDPIKIWDCLVAVCSHGGKNILLLESATSAMWTLLRLFSTGSSPVLIPSNEVVAGIVQFARVTTDEYVNLRSTAIGMLGIIAQLPQQPKNNLLEIGRLALEMLASPHAICIAEALNTIFDVFAETIHNDVVQNLEMLKILRAYVPHLKLKVKNEKRSLSRDVWDRLDEAKMNLVRFLKYKKNQ